MEPLTFCNWDFRPAVLVKDGSSIRAAFAVLAPGEDWSKVDELDVAETSGVMPEVAWRRAFEPTFGSLDVSKISRAEAAE